MHERKYSDSESAYLVATIIFIKKKKEVDLNAMGNQEIFDYLKICGCCDICCLRFFKARGDEYDDIEDSLKKLNITKNVKVEDNAGKRLRGNPCVACLDFFSDEVQEEILNNISMNQDIKEYDCDKVIIALSLPIILHIRQISLWCALVKKFSNISKEKPPDVAIKEAAKLIISKKICQNLNKIYDPSGVMINIYFSHSDETSEVLKLLKADQLMFKKNQKTKLRHEITRNYLEKNYVPASISTDVFSNYIPVPPNVADSSICLEKLRCVGPTIFVAGRYQKLSRELSHSPWVLQGKRVMEDSIQELITRCVAPYFRVPEEKIIFSSSGREDVDVRCLGKGRPFVLEVSDSRRTILPQKDAAKIELEIAKHPKISVKNLQIVKREELVYLKTGEEKKKKNYRALCTLKIPATVDIMEKLNMPNGFEINQITPIRVLHRRPLHIRPRTVYSVKAYVNKNNPKALILDIVTQAGTYIKELVHGEFGRTNPSISSIIGHWIDIVALDVTSIDLDWPKNVNNMESLDSSIAIDCK